MLCAAFAVIVVVWPLVGEVLFLRLFCSALLFDFAARFVFLGPTPLSLFLFGIGFRICFLPSISFAFLLLPLEPLVAPFFPILHGDEIPLFAKVDNFLLAPKIIRSPNPLGFRPHRSWFDVPIIIQLVLGLAPFPPFVFEALPQVGKDIAVGIVVITIVASPAAARIGGSGGRWKPGFSGILGDSRLIVGGGIAGIVRGNVR
mmetsp:Transcript_10136/g.25379  ORF Transcript_10136/g.25379 Transcript_10136/m.25379 type:complete len:202 (+) Transcript_10136:703-1308(+)